MKTKLLIIGIAALAAAPAAAQSHQGHGQAAQPPAGHGQMNHGQMGHQMRNTVANPYAEAEMRMHQRMMSAVGTDATETWVRKMIEHHRGGVETSRIVIANSRDQDVIRMARETINQREREIAELQGWLRRHGKRAQ